MKLVEHRDGTVVLRHAHVVLRVMSCCFILGALLLLTFPPARQDVRCTRATSGPQCTLDERSVFGVGAVNTVAANDVRRIAVVHEDEDSFCVELETRTGRHQVGRCSLRHEASLDRRVDALRAFFRGDRERFEHTLSDEVVLMAVAGGFLIPFVPLLLGLPVTVTTGDPRRREIRVVQRRLWRRVLRVVDLREVVEFAVVVGGANEDGPTFKLIALMAGGERVDLCDPGDDEACLRRAADALGRLAAPGGYREGGARN
ncbi:MAG: hypothetical protein AAGA56_13060 [Myxococcota bacterium]